ncbi:MAG: hypothetical protein QNJ44_15505 [Rhodobacter sp.]|nr:hypothetical protein [Rhodobacter sp.]
MGNPKKRLDISMLSETGGRENTEMPMTLDFRHDSSLLVWLQLRAGQSATADWTDADVEFMVE